MLDIVTIGASASIKEAMGIIDRNAQGVVFVVDYNRRLIGSVTDGDLRRAILRGVGINESVMKIMNTDPLYIDDNLSISKIKQFLKGKKVFSRGPFVSFMLPVVDKKKTIVDILSVYKDTFFSVKKKESKFRKVQPEVRHVLVIGGAGFIGSILVRLLLKKKYRVRVLDSFLYGDQSLQSVRMHRNLEIIRGDTRHTDVVVKAMHDIDSVVHLAELVGDLACALNPNETLQSNYFATQQIASMCKYFQINRFIYTSSCSVYGASDSEDLLTEESAVHPTSLYARMKLESERALHDLEDENFVPIILRLGTVYGLSFRPRFDLVVNTLTAKAVCERIIPIFGGNQWRPNVHVQDVSRAILKFLEAPIEKVGGNIFNVGSLEQNYRICELGDIIHFVIPEATLDIIEGKADNRNYKVDFSKIETFIGFTPSKSIEDGVRELKELLEDGALNHEDRQYSNIKFLQSFK